jgi:hypothetical protein
MGDWTLAMLFIDESLEQYEDDSSCVQGNFRKINSTAFKQTWHITSSQYGYDTVIDLPTTITHSGDWEVAEPLGGNKPADAILLQKSFCFQSHVYICKKFLYCGDSFPTYVGHITF